MYILNISVIVWIYVYSVSHFPTGLFRPNINKLKLWQETQCLKTPTGRRQTSWPHTKYSQGVELGTTDNKFSRVPDGIYLQAFFYNFSKYWEGLLGKLGISFSFFDANKIKTEKQNHKESEFHWYSWHWRGLGQLTHYCSVSELYKSPVFSPILSTTGKINYQTSRAILVPVEFSRIPIDFR